LPRSAALPDRTDRTWSSELGTAEAYVAGPAGRPEVEPARRAHVPRDVAPRAAPDHAEGRPCGGFLLLVIVGPDTVTPFPDVTQRVVQSPVIGCLAADRFRSIWAVAVIPGDLVEVTAITRRVGPRATRVFPLGLRREAKRQTIELFVQALNKFLTL